MRKYYAIAILLFLVVQFSNAQNVFRTVQDGDWNDASTWFLGGGSGGIEGINYPSPSDSVFVEHDVVISTATSGSDFIFTGYLNVAAGDSLRCIVGNSSNGFALDGNAVMHLYGIFYTADTDEQPEDSSPTAKEFTCLGNSQFIAFTGAYLFVADDWEIEENAIIYIEDDVCLRVDDDVNFNGTGWTMCGDGDISIGGDGASSTVNFSGSATSAQICTGTSILRNTTGTDCSSGTTLTTGTGASGSAPTAYDDFMTTEINTAVIIDVLDLDTADFDVALDTIQILKAGNNAAVDDNTTANGGTISINNNGTPTDFTDDFIDYTPALGFEGNDTFSYVIQDEEGETDTALVTVTVINCGNSYVELIGVGANGSTTATLNFTDTTSIDSIVLELVYKSGAPSSVSYLSSAGQTETGVNIAAINGGAVHGVSRATITSASSVTVTHDISSTARSFLAYIYRSGTTSSITSRHDREAVYLFQNSYNYQQEIPAGSTPRNIKIQMPISELNTDARSALLEVQAGPVYGSLETFSEDLGNSLKIFTMILEDVPGYVTELDVTITSRPTGLGDSFVTSGIDFGIQCSGIAPEANPDFESTPQNTAVTIDILQNDKIGDGAFDTTSITNLGLLDPQNGTVTFNSSGQAVYTPDAAFVGVDYFEYMVCDTLELCDITMVTVVVNCTGGQFTEIASDLGLDLGNAKDGGLSWADFNNDGLMDVIVNTNNGTTDTQVFFANDSSGTIIFDNVTDTHASGLEDNTNERSVVTADLNNDGYVDFVRNTYQNTGVEIWFNRGPGSTPPYSFGNGSQDENISVNTFSTSNNSGDGFNTEGLSMVDWNQDGWIDIIVENDGDGIEILENDKDGTFSEVTHANSGFSDGSGGSNKGDYSTSIDYDNDGYVDYMARRTDDADLYHFDSGTSKFVAVAGIDLESASEKGGITFCDLDQDGDFDFIWAHQADDNNTSIYIQGSDGTFTFDQDLLNDGGVEECDCADVDNDGDNDIFLGDDAGNSYLYKNNTPKGGTLSFSQDNDCIAPGADVEGSEFVDYDNDGDMDLYMNINGGSNQMWVNGQDDNNYLLVEPRINLGGGKWRSAIGANVMIIENCVDTCMIKDVSGGRGHGSQKPSVLHFGLPNGSVRSYKVITFFPDSGGTIDTVIQTVNPSSLENQKLIVYQTDADFDLCLDSDMDGVLDDDDIDDDNDGVLDADEGCPLFVSTVTSQTGVDDSGNVTGSPDGLYADFYSNGDIMVIDFGTTYPAGTEYTFYWEEEAVESGTASLIIEESTDNVTYFTHGNAPTTNSTSLVTHTRASSRSFRYLRISKDNPPSSTDFEIDAVSVSSCTDSDGDGIPNRIDLDSDNDGIPDIVEAGGVDTDNDGRVDGAFTDTDGDGWSNTFDSNDGGTALTDPDTDGDGLNDRIDLDADNDGIPDLVEAGGVDINGDGKVDDLNFLGGLEEDSNFNGWAKLYDGSDSGNAISDPDTDGDGIKDRLDLDADNDGIPDVVEVGGSDENGDGRADDYVDTDGDGYNDVVDSDVGNDLAFENYSDALQVTGFDADDNGVPDTYGEDDTDGDGIRNQLDLDSDNDGIPDVVEVGGTDENGNGIADDYVDADGDGFNDVVDGDPTNVLAVGSDAAGANTTDALLVTGTDTDGDGEPNSFPNDDPDKDLIYNFLDLDADNDGIPDVVEQGGSDENGDGRADDYADADGDGFNDVVDGDPTNALAFNSDANGANTGDALTTTGADTDGDGAPNTFPNDEPDGDNVYNFLDLDADDDGIPDVVEQGGTDENGDGRADDYIDADNDGFNDRVDGDPTNALALGSDIAGANTADALTVTGTDTDGDGAPNSYPNGEFDGDNVYNFLDLDADDDGILDVIEAGGTDTDRDGQEDSFVDADGDGFNDVVDGDPTNALALGSDAAGANTGNATTVTGVDADLDGAPDTKPNDNFDSDNHYNFLDIDADNDGIVDNTEGQTTAGYVAPANADADGDGIDDAYDSDDANFSGINSSFELSDIDSATDADSPDYLDLDTDGDGEVDTIEGHDSDNDGTADASSPANTGVSGGTTDIDNDGLYDGWDNNTASVDPTNTSLQGTSHPNPTIATTTERDWRETDDHDMDGISDNDDIDDDNDGILDIDEACPLFSGTVTSSSGVVNSGNVTGSPDGSSADWYVDGDILVLDFATIYPAGTQYTIYWNERASQSGTPAPLIEESTDNSAYTTNSVSPTTNSTTIISTVHNSQSSFRYLRISKDNPPSSTDFEIDAISVNTCTDKDGDGVPNNFDVDTDNDGITDIIESGGVDADNNGVVDGAFTDTDNDGWSNTFDSDDGGAALADGDQDGDTYPNRCDLDSDNDGIADIIEAGGVDTNGDGVVESAADTDSDGLADTFDSDNGGTALTVPETDGDGIANYLDIDSDSDGLLDNVEGQTTVAFMAPTGTDTDGDGWDNRYDSDDGGTAIVLSNNEAAGNPDYTDDDSDGDGLVDWIEGFDDDEDGDALDDLTLRATNFETAAGNPLFYVNTDDADADNIPDWLEDDDADNVPNFLDPDHGDYHDTDGDGLVDLYDTDNFGVASILPDGDADGEYDFRDTDDNISLPIELLDFTAYKVGNYVRIEWSTLSQINNDYFTIERSSDGENFEPLMIIDGAGTHTGMLSYTERDFNPLNGISYYRLKQTDFDGKFEHFEPKAVNFSSGEDRLFQVDVFPNPSNGEKINIKYRGISIERTSVILRNLVGELVYSTQLSNMEDGVISTIRPINLAKGMYILQLKNEIGIESFQIVVQ